VIAKVSAIRESTTAPEGAAEEMTDFFSSPLKAAQRRRNQHRVPRRLSIAAKECWILPQ